jgi:hypothetical protein
MVTLHEATSLQNNANGFTVRRKGQNPNSYHIETHFHAANPSAAFVIDRYGVTGTLRRGVRNVLQYGTRYGNRTRLSSVKG